MPRAKKSETVETEVTEKEENGTISTGEEKEEEKETKATTKKKTTKAKKLSELEKIMVQMKMENGMSEDEAIEEVKEQDGQVDIDLSAIAIGEDLLGDETEEESAEDEGYESSELAEDTEIEEISESEKVSEKDLKDTDKPSWKNVFFGKRVKSASDNMRRSIYRENYFVETGEFTDQVVLKKDIRKREYELLAAAANSTVTHHPTILKGYLSGITSVQGMDLAEIEYTGIFNARNDDVQPFEFFRIQIPIYMLFPVTDKYVKETMKISRGLVGLAEKRLGMPVEFMVWRVMEAAGVAYATRIHALSTIATLNFSFRKDKENFSKGRVVQGTITGTNRRGIFVNVAGVESYISQEDLSWNRIEDCSEAYHIGDAINVKIMDIKNTEIETFNRNHNQKSKLPYFDIKMSVKETIVNPNDLYYNEFTIGSLYQGKVTQINEEGYFVELTKRKFQVFCQIPETNRLPIVGDRVNVRIKKKDDTRKKTFASIVSVF